MKNCYLLLISFDFEQLKCPLFLQFSGCNPLSFWERDWKLYLFIYLRHKYLYLLRLALKIPLCVSHRGERLRERNDSQFSACIGWQGVASYCWNLLRKALGYLCCIPSFLYVHCPLSIHPGEIKTHHVNLKKICSLPLSYSLSALTFFPTAPLNVPPGVCMADAKH